METKKIKRRKDSFFGLHFDFHASPAGERCAIGETLSEDEIREICAEIKPDFLQIDCKGHPGWASYPTKCGNAMPRIAGDPLMLWRRVTAEEGVALYVHYSGVVDVKYCTENPKQCVMKADGTRKPWATRTNGSYVDELLIPQLCEIAGKYGLNGAWVDGECWGIEADYDPDTVSAFEKETGIDLKGKLPAEKDDPYYDEYRDYCRELFRRYVRHYVETVHARFPDFQIASNWAFTDHMPEKVSADVDFISGDLNPQISFESARYAARAIAQQERPWDLMSWNFRSRLTVMPGHVIKHPNQIMQEAAAVIALGGGFQNYIGQYGDGSPRMEQIRRMKSVSEFLRARERYCFRGKAVHQAALVLSTFDRHLESESLFSRTGMERVMGMTSLLCDSGQSLEIVSEHTFEGHEADYPVLVVPELKYGLAESTAKSLLRYVSKGGSLLIVGPGSCKLFAKYGIPVEISEDDCVINRDKHGSQLFTLNGQEFGRVKNVCGVYSEGSEIIARMGKSERSADKPFSLLIKYGSGLIGLIGTDIGTAYGECAQYLHIDLVNAFLSRMYDPIVKIEKAQGKLEIVVLEKEGRLYVQLVNANGQHRDISIASDRFISPCVDIRLSLKTNGKPDKLILQPEGRELDFEWCGSRAYVNVDRVAIHEVIEVRM